MTGIIKKLKSFFIYGVPTTTASSSSLSQTSVVNTLKSLSGFLKVNSDPNDQWRIISELSDGAFGKIYKAEHVTSKKLAALKQVDLINDEDNITDYCVEVKALCDINHINVIKLYEAFYFNSKIWMFLEYCKVGSLDTIMQELERPMNEKQIRSVARQLCLALTYLHETCFIIHRDVKAANVLVTDEACIKLGDFGVSALCSAADSRRNSFIGSPYWMAPELIECEVSREHSYDCKVDVWSLGILMIELAQLDPPFNKMNPSRVTLKIIKSPPPILDKPGDWSDDFNSFVACCLQKDPHIRYRSSQLLQVSK
ncbi:hypothetical protein HELRODRAFT_79008 [Helobdella robusta]|uniref:Protein kinase domain-containing protein n=1 Tax=Helobdella robusta TaxID=6412 RepID=T1G3I3_HELRO|nr:hypothetical protein HELRODRAFT_79008 [Helobdella robusta]ESO04677.1 hypothetical protein HELRODRAFT_79008 [Helobdella robusta]